jgi:hypothetical protein
MVTITATLTIGKNTTARKVKNTIPGVATTASPIKAADTARRARQKKVIAD